MTVVRCLTSAAVALCLVGCGPEDPNPTVPGTGAGTSGGTPAGTGTPGGTLPTGSTTDSTVPTGEVFDCATIPIEPVSLQALTDPRGYHDVAFTTDGWIIGNNTGNSDLVMADGLGNTDVLVNGIGQVQQMVWLPDGDLAVANDTSGAILRVTSSGTVTPISPGVGAYGLILGPDGKLWAANYASVMRIDIATGNQEVILSSLPSGQPRVINFNRDFTRLYIGTMSGNGNLYYLDLDANYDPISGPQVLATDVGTGSYHDGLGVDICGYIYVPDYSTSALYRISPSGQVQNYLDGTLNQYGHGLEWGNGVGPWLTDAIYIPQPYNNNHVAEVVLGVPTVWSGTVINAPLP